MDTFEEEITNEKDMISKDDLDKSNSLAIKSLDATAFDFIELLKDKFFLLVTSKKTNNAINIRNNSILKIFELFCDKNNKENIETNLLNYITCIINEGEDLGTQNYANENSVGVCVLDAPYVELLKQTKNYKINFNIKGIKENPYEDIKKNLLLYEEQNNKINIKANSLKKICKFLGKSIFDISDYINVLVLYLNEEEINKAFIQKKIIDKYNSKSGENFYFNGIKKFETKLILPEKNKKNSIYKLNSLFDKILNKMDNVENISDLSDDNMEKNEIKIDNIPKKYIGQKYENEINNNKNDEEENRLPRDDNKFNCQKDICENCLVF